MKRGKQVMSRTSILVSIGAVILAALFPVPDAIRTNHSKYFGCARASFIVQAASLQQAVGAVQDVGGEITHELGDHQRGRGSPDGRAARDSRRPCRRSAPTEIAKPKSPKKPSSPTGEISQTSSMTASYSNNDGTYSWSGALDRNLR